MTDQDKPRGESDEEKVGHPRSALAVVMLSRRRALIEDARASHVQLCANCGHTWHRHHAFSDVQSRFVEHPCELQLTCNCKGWRVATKVSRGQRSNDEQT